MGAISKRLKDTLQKEMEYGKIYSTDEIRDLIYERTGMKYGADYMETHFAGCLNALKKSGDITPVQRGEYRRKDPLQINQSESSGSEESRTLFLAQTRKEVLESLQRERAYLRSVTQDVVLSLDAPMADLQYMLKLKEMDRVLEELERMMGY